MNKKIVIPGDGEKPESDNSDPTVVLEESISVIEDTTLADAHAPASELRKQISEGKEDWGDGFFVENEPVLVTRGRDGSIIRTTPLSDIPGVDYKTQEQEEAEAVVAEAKPKPVPLSRSDREKLVGILAGRLFRYYKDRGPGDPRFNPLRDGIPDVPAGSPENLQPLPGMKLYPATDGQVHEWITRFIASRVSVIDKGRFGQGQLQDLALHIE